MREGEEREKRERGGKREGRGLSGEDWRGRGREGGSGLRERKRGGRELEFGKY